MNDEPRVLQAADVYNATHDLPLYEWVASLESQNQALQREVENKAAILNAIEALLDVDDEHTGWDRIVALQEENESLGLFVKEAHEETLALQEELRKYQPGQGEGWPDDRHEFAGRLTALREAAEALQERAEKAEKERDALIQWCFDKGIGIPLGD